MHPNLEFIVETTDGDRHLFRDWDRAVKRLEGQDGLIDIRVLCRAAAVVYGGEAAGKLFDQHGPGLLERWHVLSGRVYACLGHASER